MRFEERELKEYAEPVLPDQLQTGKVYFSLIFLDESGLVPNLEPRVFVGSKAEPEGNSSTSKTSPPTGVGFGSSHLTPMKKPHLLLGQGVTSSNTSARSMF
jgi:hypothetical protein